MGKCTQEFGSLLELPSCCLPRPDCRDIVSLRELVDGLVRRPGQVLRVGRAQALYEMHQIPSLGGADRVGERRHRSAIQTANEHPVYRRSGVTALDVAFGEVIRHDGVAPVIRKIVRRRAIAFRTITMALRTVELFVYGRAAFYRFGTIRWLRRNGDRRLRLIGRKARRKSLDVGDDIEPLLVAQRSTKA